MGRGLGLSLAIYLVLQLAFLLAVPPANLVRGWGGLTLTAQGGPLVAVVLAVGLPLLATLLITDAVVSPSATAMTYMGTAARVNWMMANLGLLPVRFAGLNRAGVPAPALLATLLVGLGLLLAGPSWSGAVSLVTAALVMALAMGPVSLLALRRQRPDLPRPYRLPLAEVLCPLAFVVASWAIVWCGWSSLRLTVPLVLLPTLLQLVRGRPADGVGVLWWFPYLIGLGLAAALLGPGRPWALPSWQLLLVSGGFAVAMFPLALASRLEEPSPEAGLRL
jgi:amino acid transporter